MNGAQNLTKAPKGRIGWQGPAEATDGCWIPVGEPVEPRRSLVCRDPYPKAQAVSRQVATTMLAGGQILPPLPSPGVQAIYWSLPRYRVLAI